MTTLKKIPEPHVRGMAGNVLSQIKTWIEAQRSEQAKRKNKLT